MKCARIALALVLLTRGSLSAQMADSTATISTGDSIADRALQLSKEGNAGAARTLLDSALRVATPDDTSYGNRLYWRASLATTGADSARFYSRILIEAPLSPRGEDALVQLATLDETRGDRAGAADLLTRFMLSYPASAQRPHVAVTLVRLLFDDAQVARGCTALGWARNAVPPENVELRNRIEYYAPRCANLSADSAIAADTTSAPPRDTSSTRRPAVPARPVTPPRDTSSTRRPTVPARPVTPPPAVRSAPDSVTIYSLQVAAYDTKPPADRMAKSLVARGIDARVDGTVRPFRVRIGTYATQAEALQAIAALKVKGITGFLATARVPRK